MKSKIKKNDAPKSYRQKLLATMVAALCTGVVSTSVTQASDINIYQEAKSGKITLMLMLDNSGSMGTTENSTGLTRLESVRNGVIDVLAGSSAATAISDDKIIGLASFYDSSSGYVMVPARALDTAISGGGTYTQKKPIYRQYINSSNKTAYNSCTAWSDYDTCTTWGAETTSKPSGNYSSTTCEKINGQTCTLYYTNVTMNVTDQRTLLLSKMSTWTGNYSTPTGEAYAEVGAYMLGTATGKGTQWYSCGSSGSTKQNQCTTITTAPSSTADYKTTSSGTSTYYYTKNGNQTTYYYKAVSSSTSGSGFAYSTSDAKNSNETAYVSPVSTSEVQCSGQGIYFLTDGEPNGAGDSTVKTLMQNALTSTYSNDMTCSGTLFNGTGANYSGNAWTCISDFSQLLLNNTSTGATSTTQTNPLGLVIKTAVVGFGSSFNSLTSYDSAKTQLQNLNAVAGLVSTNTDFTKIKNALSSDVKKAAAWGIYGEGGWYSGNSSKDVVDSINAFLGNLGTNIPAVTTGSSTVPKDSLNPSVLQVQAYFPQFQPTPDKSYQLWAGNLKKYNVVDGVLKDKNKNKIQNSDGEIIDNYDLWSPAVDVSVKDADENTYGSTKFALKGGAWSQLKLKIVSGASTESRKLFTNRIAKTASGTVSFETGSDLRRITSADLTDSTYKNDSNRGYLMALLGYAVNSTEAANPANITSTSLAAASELRQIGAVMHSSPILVTNSGTITYSNNTVGSTDRKDYVLFGTTQGLLHVVDAKTGEEKFAFVPNEIIEKQKEAFLKYDTTSGGLNKLFYGIDAPWTAYTEYVVNADGSLTVGNSTIANSTEQGKQVAYGGLRMGGRSYYALNLQDIDKPELLFQIAPDDQKVYANGSSKTFSQLQYMGQSWSKPTITWVKWGKTRKRVMFVGGGYDAGGTTGNDNNGGYESSDYNQTNGIGGGVYMFDAENGDLLWWASSKATTSSATTNSGVIGLKDANLQYSVVSEIRAEDRNGDGLADHLYFGDLGGQLFRIDIDNAATTLGAFAKTPRRLLNLNAAARSPRFYEMPAFSVYDYSGKTFAVISIGSGNRSVPLQEYSVGTSGYDYDAVYNIYDRDVARSDLYTTSSFNTQNLTKANLGEVTQANRNDNTSLVAAYPQSAIDKQGWYYRFMSNKVQSAKVFATPTVLSSRLFVSTFDASKDGLSGDCGAGVKGESFVNQFCMPYGQCPIKDANGNPIDPPECSSDDGCSIGAGIQDLIIVDPTCNPESASYNEETGTCDKSGSGGGSETGTNKNYCIATGSRSIGGISSGVIGNTSVSRCLVPQRWYVR